jgi:hypothetical protein
MPVPKIRLSYANVVSTLCLFLVLGGGAAFAATRLAKNSVGTAQIRNGAVTGAKIANGAVSGAKVNLGSLGTVPSAADAANASHATKADSATHAGSADSATHANSADTAGHATSADTASQATNASHAASADTATNAGALGGLAASEYQPKVMWARVDSAGTILSSSAGITLQDHSTTGAYYLHFPAPVAEKALTVTGSWTPTESGKSPSYKAVSCGSGGANCSAGTNTTSDLYVEVTAAGAVSNGSFFVTITP